MKRELLEQALEIEPEFLDAMAELAFSQRRSSRQALWAENFDAAEWHDEQYRSLSGKVLAQEPGHPFVNATLAWEELYKPDLRRAVMHTERALETEPTHFGALTTAGEILSRRWRAEQAIPILRYASERDPLFSHHFENLAKAYMNTGQYAAAEEACRVQLVLDPESGQHFTGWCIGRALLLQGKAVEALQYFEENVSYDPLRWHGRTLALHSLGRTDEALAELARLLNTGELFGTNPEYDGLYWFIGTAYAWIGAADKAFESFEKQREVAPRIFTSVGDSPLYGNLHNDPRWLPFLASINLDPDFLASVESNPRLPAGIR